MFLNNDMMKHAFRKINLRRKYLIKEPWARNQMKEMDLEVISIKRHLALGHRKIKVHWLERERERKNMNWIYKIILGEHPWKELNSENDSFGSSNDVIRTKFSLTSVSPWAGLTLTDSPMEVQSCLKKFHHQFLWHSWLAVKNGLLSRFILKLLGFSLIG